MHVLSRLAVIRYVARRLLAIASEDIGNADPRMRCGLLWPLGIVSNG